MVETSQRVGNSNAKKNKPLPTPERLVWWMSNPEEIDTRIGNRLW